MTCLKLDFIFLIFNAQLNISYHTPPNILVLKGKDAGFSILSGAT